MTHVTLDRHTAPRHSPFRNALAQTAEMDGSELAALVDACETQVDATSLPSADDRPAVIEHIAEVLGEAESWCINREGLCSVRYR